MRWGMLTFLVVVLRTVAVWAQDPGPALAPGPGGALEDVAVVEEVGEKEDGIKEDVTRVKVRFSSQHVAQYRAYSTVGNVIADTSMALLLASQVPLVFNMLQGHAGGGGCFPEDEYDDATDCSEEKNQKRAWIALLSTGMTLFAVGFPFLHASQMREENIASQVQDFGSGFKKLRAAAWTFYALSMASMTVVIIGMSFESSWRYIDIPALVGQSFAIAFAQVAALLNFICWGLTRKKLKGALKQPTTASRAVFPFISPVHGGMIAGLGGTF